MSIEFKPAVADMKDVVILAGDAVPYESFVCVLVKDMGSDTLDLLHAAVGIAGEAGELIDAIKKHWAYGKPLDRVNVIEELGDLEFYMAALRQKLGISRVEVLDANAAKLEVRYSAGYSDAAAIARADKTEAALEAGSEKYQKLLREQGKTVAINLPAASVEGMDDTAGITSSAPDYEKQSRSAEEFAAMQSTDGLLTPLPQIPSVSQDSEQVDSGSPQEAPRP